MSSRVLRLLEEALQLSDDERAELAVRLLDSVGEPPDEVERAWIAEAQRRFAEFERGEVQTLPWAEVRKRVFGVAPAIEAGWTDEGRKRIAEVDSGEVATLSNEEAQRIIAADD